MKVEKEILKITWNALIDEYHIKYQYPLRFEKYIYDETFVGRFIWLWAEDAFAHMALKQHDKKVHYYKVRAENDDDDIDLTSNGRSAFISIVKHMPEDQKYRLHLTEDDWKTFVEHDYDLDYRPPTTSGIHGFNEKFNGTRNNHCFEYDVNSSFPYGAIQPVADFTKPLGMGPLEEGQIGYRIPGVNTGPVVLQKGVLCDDRYPLMPSPYIDWANHWYPKKKKAKTHAEKSNAKNNLNKGIGMLQHHNYYDRNTFIVRSNNRINNWVNYLNINYPDCLLSWTVDNLIVTKRIPELDVLCGPELGQFKLEHDNMPFAYIGGKKQWGTPYIKGQPTTVIWSGQNKARIELDDFDLLKDNVDNKSIRWYINEEGRIIVNE